MWQNENNTKMKRIQLGPLISESKEHHVSSHQKELL